MRVLFLFLLAIQICTVASAGTKKADRYFENWDYYRAAQFYEKEALKNPSMGLYYRLGQCYLKMNDITKALLNYDRVNDSGKFAVPEFYFEYGQLLRISGNYDDAKVAFNKFKAMVPADKRTKYFSDACDLAVEDHKYDLPVMVSPMTSLNSKYADFAPVPYRDGVVFTSARGNNKHNKIDYRSGSYYFNLFYAPKTSPDSAFGEVIPMPEIANQKYHDGPACFSGTYDTVFFARVERGLKGQEKWTLGVEQIKLYSATREEGKWNHIEPFYLDNDSFSVTDPFISRDGQRLYFVSNRKGGYGETDIWYCQRSRLGWGKPINMGTKVNTFGRERSPYEDAEGNFYFSSDGYQGFGGLDICVALKKRGILEKAKPMKQPINSSFDDFGIVVLKGGRTGYFASNRTGGKGDDDIYYFNMGEDSTLFTKVYTMGYKPPVKEEKPPVVKVDTVVKKEAPLVVVKSTPVAPKPEKPAPPIIIHDTVRVTSHTYTTIKTSVKEDIFDLPDDKKAPPDLDKDNPSFGLIAHFDLSRYDIKREDFKKLDCIAGWLKEHPKQQIWVEGHADTRASEEYNMDISKKRADAAVQYLVNKGIARIRLFPVGYGSSRLVNFCGKGRPCPELMQEANRRVEFKLKRG